MRLSNNANDFRAAVEKALWRFSNRKLDWMKRYGPQFAEKIRDSKEAILEHHLRIYLINEVLRALNWSLTPDAPEEPNLVAELPIISPDTGTTKFIDYLGLEAATATRCWSSKQSVMDRRLLSHPRRPTLPCRPSSPARSLVRNNCPMTGRIG